MAFSDKLRTIRKRKGMTQEDLAGRLGVSARTVSEWERGISRPDEAQAAELNRVLGVGRGELSASDKTPSIKKIAARDRRRAGIWMIAFSLLALAVMYALLCMVFYTDLELPFRLGQALRVCRAGLAEYKLGIADTGLKVLLGCGIVLMISGYFKI